MIWITTHSTNWPLTNIHNLNTRLERWSDWSHHVFLSLISHFIQRDNKFHQNILFIWITDYFDQTTRHFFKYRFCPNNWHLWVSWSLYQNCHYSDSLCIKLKVFMAYFLGWSLCHRYPVSFDGCEGFRLALLHVRGDCGTPAQDLHQPQPQLWVQRSGRRTPRSPQQSRKSCAAYSEIFQQKVDGWWNRRKGKLSHRSHLKVLCHRVFLSRHWVLKQRNYSSEGLFGEKKCLLFWGQFH